MARILSVDLGERRVGLAVSDDEGRVAMGLDTLSVTGLKDAVRQVAGRAGERDASLIVVGLPLTLAGVEGPAAGRAREFARRLEEAARRPVEMWDERMTTAQGLRALREAERPRDRARGDADRAAAVLILQSYLDARRARGEGGA